MKKKVSLFLVFVLTMLTLVGSINVQDAKAATIGEVLLTPEEGWRRYEGTNTDQRFEYTGNWTSARNYTYHKTGYITFSFYGSKIRFLKVLDMYGSLNYSVTIDGVNYKSSNTNIKYSNDNILFFEVNGLPLTKHKVVIDTTTADSSHHVSLGAIDIDEAGYLIGPSDVLAESISLDKTSINMVEGASEKLTATVLPDNAINKKVIWSSSDTNIATVDENGNVTAVKEGQSTIMAKVEGTELTDTCVVNVTKAQLPEETGNAILSISLVNGSTKQYDVSMTEVNKFIQWYETRTKGEGSNIYAFSKKESPFKEIKEYIAQDKIASFEVKEYVSAN